MPSPASSMCTCRAGDLSAVRPCKLHSKWGYYNIVSPRKNKIHVLLSLVSWLFVRKASFMPGSATKTTRFIHAVYVATWPGLQNIDLHATYSSTLASSRLKASLKHQPGSSLRILYVESERRQYRFQWESTSTRQGLSFGDA